MSSPVGLRRCNRLVNAQQHGDGCKHACGKIDIPDGRELADFVRPALEERGYRVFEISAVSREGLKELSYALAEIVEEGRAAKAAEPQKSRIVIRPKVRGELEFVVKVEGGTEPLYRVLGTKPERWVQQTDFNNDEAVGFLADRLAKLGVEEELFKQGAVPARPS